MSNKNHYIGELIYVSDQLAMVVGYDQKRLNRHKLVWLKTGEESWHHSMYIRRHLFDRTHLTVEGIEDDYY